MRKAFSRGFGFAFRLGIVLLRATKRRGALSLWGTKERWRGHRGTLPEWLGVLARFEKEGFPTEASLFIRSLSGAPLTVQLERVNQFWNSCRYVSDLENYGEADYWATPKEFFKRGGDCEEYAIAKYLSLAALGWNAADLRVVRVVVPEKQQSTPHIILLVSCEGQKVLDNEYTAVVDAQDINHYRPIFGLSTHGWGQYVPVENEKPTT